MEIAIYVKELLYNHESVILAGVGEFYTQAQAARISSDEGTILPPSKVVLINISKTLTNGLVENYIATRKNIPANEATAFVATQVKTLITKLNQGHTLHFEGLGYLSKEENIIRFEQEQGTNFYTGVYGLTAVEIKPVEVTLTPEKPIVKEKAKEVKIEKAKEAPRPAVKIEKKKSKLLSTLLKVFVLLIIAGGAFISYPYLKSYIFQRNPKHTSPPSVEASKSTPESPVESIVDKATDKKNALALPSEPKQASDTMFYIIVGSFKTYDRAQILAKQLESEGAKPEIIQFSSQLFRVSLGEFNQKNIAKLELEKIRAIKGSEAAWIFSQKK